MNSQNSLRFRDKPVYYNPVYLAKLAKAHVWETKQWELGTLIENRIAYFGERATDVNTKSKARERAEYKTAKAWLKMDGRYPNALHPKALVSVKAALHLSRAIATLAKEDKKHFFQHYTDHRLERDMKMLGSALEGIQVTPQLSKEIEEISKNLLAASGYIMKYFSMRAEYASRYDGPYEEATMKDWAGEYKIFATVTIKLVKLMNFRETLPGERNLDTLATALLFSRFLEKINRTTNEYIARYSSIRASPGFVLADNVISTWAGAFQTEYNSSDNERKRWIKEQIIEVLTLAYNNYPDEKLADNIVFGQNGWLSKVYNYGALPP